MSAPVRAAPVGVAHESGQDIPLRALQVVREVAIGGLAAVLASLAVIGIGGRLFMRAAALIDPAATGVLTSNGNRIGEITLDGTIAFLVFGGGLFGAVVAIVWVVASPWIPGRGTGRALLTAVVAVAVSAFFVIKADERDFRVLDPAAASVAMVIGLIALLGAVISLTDERLRRRLPAIRSVTQRSTPIYLGLALVGLVAMPILISAYFVEEVGRRDPPILVGAALVVVGLATLARWWRRIVDGRDEPGRTLVAVGRGGLVAAVVLGAIRVASEAAPILSPAG